MAASVPASSSAVAATGTQPPIILGSGSQTRQEILREMGFAFTIKTADIDERAERGDSSHHCPELIIFLQILNLCLGVVGWLISCAT